MLTNNPIGNARFGFTISIVTTILTVVTFGIAICTPPLSGPFCPGDCFQYPYADIADRFPRDYYWMYFAIFLTLSYLLLVISLYQITPPEKKQYSLAVISFALMSSLILVVDYFIQVSVIQPSLLAGETEGIAILTQFNPHGIFIVLEELGFLLMILSFGFLIPVFSVGSKLEKSIKWTIIITIILTIIAFVLITITHGIQREYRFEVAIISIAWIELIVLSILFSRYYKGIIKQTA